MIRRRCLPHRVPHERRAQPHSPTNGTPARSPDDSPSEAGPCVRSRWPVNASSSGPIPDDIRRFIIDYIDSVPALEALLLMHRKPEQDWSVVMLAAELYMDARDVEPILADLSHRGLCTSRQGKEPYRWGPATSELTDFLHRLAAIYSRHLVPVTNLIHSKPSASVRGFPAAFRLRRDE